MADNYLELRQEDYEKRKAEWLRRKKAGAATHATTKKAAQ